MKPKRGRQPVGGSACETNSVVKGEDGASRIKLGRDVRFRLSLGAWWNFERTLEAQREYRPTAGGYLLAGEGVRAGFPKRLHWEIEKLTGTVTPAG